MPLTEVKARLTVVSRWRLPRTTVMPSCPLESQLAQQRLGKQVSGRVFEISMLETIALITAMRNNCRRAIVI